MPRIVDHTGKVANGHTVIGPSSSWPRRKWRFRCPNGHEFESAFDAVNNGKRKCSECRTHYGRYQDLAGMAFGHLVVTGRANSKNSKAVWAAKCSICEKTFSRYTSTLRKIKICPCNRARTSLRHAVRRTPTYGSWASMMARCYVRQSPSYKRYGLRGITVADRWHSFAKFLADMGERPAGTTIDRIDNSKGYSPCNCRWATRVEQQSNRGNTSFVTYLGKTQSLSDWARETGIKHSTLRSRIIRKGWPIERALREPVRKRCHQ